MIPVVVSSVDPIIFGIKSLLVLCTVATRSHPSSMIKWGLWSKTVWTCFAYVSLSSPAIANTGMPQYLTRAAATSSWVERGFEAARTASAPPSFIAIQSAAVSLGTWTHAVSLKPSKGFSFLNLSVIFAKTGISFCAHSIFFFPCSAKFMSLIS